MGICFLPDIDIDIDIVLTSKLLAFQIQQQIDQSTPKK